MSEMLSAQKVQNMNYAEFCNFIDEISLEPYIVYEDSFAIYKYQDHFFYIECGENDAYEKCEVSLIATLHYNPENDIKVGGETLSTLFDCDVCGERVAFDDIRYCWFKKIEQNSSCKKYGYVTARIKNWRNNK